MPLWVKLMTIYIYTIYNTESFCRLLEKMHSDTYSALVYPHTPHCLHPAPQKLVNPRFPGVLTYKYGITPDISLYHCCPWLKDRTANFYCLISIHVSTQAMCTEEGVIQNKVYETLTLIFITIKDPQFKMRWCIFPACLCLQWGNQAFVYFLQV